MTADKFRLVFPVFIMLVVVVSCSTRERSRPSDSAVRHEAAGRVEGLTPQTDKPIDLPGLHNVVEYSPGVYSGGVPEGDEGFAMLKKMGVRTILSVDGAQPDADGAARVGMRYVHLPIGYNGMDRKRTLEIARVIRDLPGPTYIHCHHGQHRSAAATGAALVTLGKLTSEQAVARMKVSGTSSNYPGLYGCVTVAAVASEPELDAASNEFPAHWKTSDFVEAMVEIDEAHDNLKLIEKGGWKTPKDHPDLVPAAEAGRLADHFRNLQDDEYVAQRPEELSRWFEEDARKASQLEEALVAGNVRKEKLSEYFASVGRSCRDCHAKYRNQ